MPPRLIGQIPSLDGRIRNVYQDEVGQFVLGNSNERVYGHWILQHDPTLQATCNSCAS